MTKNESSILIDLVYDTNAVIYSLAEYSTLFKNGQVLKGYSCAYCRTPVSFVHKKIKTLSGYFRHTNATTNDLTSYCEKYKGGAEQGINVSSAISKKSFSSIYPSICLEFLEKETTAILSKTAERDISIVHRRKAMKNKLFDGILGLAPYKFLYKNNHEAPLKRVINKFKEPPPGATIAVSRMYALRIRLLSSGEKTLKEILWFCLYYAHLTLKKQPYLFPGGKYEGRVKQTLNKILCDSITTEEFENEFETLFTVNQKNYFMQLLINSIEFGLSDISVYESICKTYKSIPELQGLKNLSYVYLIAFSEDSPFFKNTWFKIGKSYSPDKRARELEGQTPFKYTVLDYVFHENIYDLEKNIRDQLAIRLNTKIVPGKEFVEWPAALSRQNLVRLFKIVSHQCLKNIDLQR